MTELNVENSFEIHLYNSDCLRPLGVHAFMCKCCYFAVVVGDQGASRRVANDNKGASLLSYVCATFEKRSRFNFECVVTIVQVALVFQTSPCHYFLNWNQTCLH